MPRGCGTTKRSWAANSSRTKIQMLAAEAVMLTAGFIGAIINRIETEKYRTIKKPKKRAVSKTTSKQDEPIVKTVEIIEEAIPAETEEETEVLRPFANLSYAIDKARKRDVAKLKKKHNVTKEESEMFSMVRKVFSGLPVLLYRIVEELREDGLDLVLEIYDEDGPYQAKQTKNGLCIELHTNGIGNVEGIYFLGISPLWCVKFSEAARKAGQKMTDEQRWKYFLRLRFGIKDLVASKGYHVIVREKEEFGSVTIEVAEEGSQLKFRKQGSQEILKPRVLQGKLKALILESVSHC